MFYTAKIPWIVKKIFPSLIYNIDKGEKTVFITFDDGPVTQTTPQILEILDDFNAKATFFCLGEYIENYPGLFEMIKEKGHSVGNHTYYHKNGWITRNIDYFRDVEKADAIINSNLFRPPYGKLKPSQIKYLKKKYKIVMWDVVSGDFDPATTKEKCYTNVMKNVENGSIIVFHDSLNAKEKMLDVLPRVLKELSELGYVFEGL